jgi:hypothetical protein
VIGALKRLFGIRATSAVVSFNTPHAAEDSDAELSKRATVAADDGRFVEAIELLKRADTKRNLLMPNRCRVLRWHQQRGAYDDCLGEIKSIAEDVPRRIASDFSHQPYRIQAGLMCHELATLADQARISTKRQKDNVRTDRFIELHAELRSLAFSIQGRDQDDTNRVEEDVRSLANFPDDASIRSRISAAINAIVDAAN